MPTIYTLWPKKRLQKGRQKGIIINTFIDHKGRQNFTFAHELGHYFLEHLPSNAPDGQLGFSCVTDDIGDSKILREIEANRFAAELLMPEDRFRLDMAGAPLDFALITGLANRYMVSKHACSNRILEFTYSPCIIIRTRGRNVTGWSASRAARGFLRKMDVMPEDTTAHRLIASQMWQKEFTPCTAGKWFTRAIPGNEIFECTHIHRESGTAMTMLKW